MLFRSKWKINIRKYDVLSPAFLHTQTQSRTLALVDILVDPFHIRQLRLKPLDINPLQACGAIIDNDKPYLSFCHIRTKSGKLGRHIVCPSVDRIVTREYYVNGQRDLSFDER